MKLYYNNCSTQLHLVMLENTEQHKHLIAQLLSHYKCYYEEKSNAAREDVFLFMNPPWLSSFERTLLWLGGFKPLVMFRLINNSVTDLTPEQSERIEQVRFETRIEERALTETMASVQESLASPLILNLSRRFRQMIDGEVSEMEAALEGLKTAMFALSENADALRRSTAVNLLEVLSPAQAVRFLATALKFQLQVMRQG
ncbi:Transcription factor HBP-1b, putative [Ricinus communis]|uniref:Transcription factor HBP-1b, putative n=1 Tax=Ricinus communis TaxID=3988 RepID=B9R6R3_RICCO|nr:Transcription factor HBP-1b, putative [Ricinus communis]